MTHCLRSTMAWTLLSLLGPAMKANLRAQEPPWPGTRAAITIRGIYGGVPTQIFDRGKTLERLRSERRLDRVRLRQPGAGHKPQGKFPGLKVFAEFNTMHEASYLKDHADARPIGADGQVSPPPDGWQGVCPTHPGYRRQRMEAFRQTLRDAPIDGIWLDYHHAHASWEQAVPKLPDTCFCDRCLSQFARETGISLPISRRPTGAEVLGYREEGLGAVAMRRLYRLGPRVSRHRHRGTAGALLGTFHCPWSESDHDSDCATSWPST